MPTGRAGSSRDRCSPRWATAFPGAGRAADPDGSRAAVAPLDRRGGCPRPQPGPPTAPMPTRARGSYRPPTGEVPVIFKEDDKDAVSILARFFADE
ncbi:hypothetical protein GCM10025866_11480 [Naasia aerilata]|uniref:Uncharacterized protein n=1 Tax=Naasia aerilata TaxID=1162966 RepID=A0ABM8GAK0_9MICO|nr:hypothetical protein GCM10025866_11480 [Naasia aerilata]